MGPKLKPETIKSKCSPNNGWIGNSQFATDIPLWCHMVALLCHTLSICTLLSHHVPSIDGTRAVIAPVNDPVQNDQWEPGTVMATMIWEYMTMTSWRLKSPASPLYAQLFVQAQIRENIKVPRHWPLWGEFTDDRWIPRTKGQLRGECFHSMMSSYISFKDPPAVDVLTKVYIWSMSLFALHITVALSPNIRPW